MSAVDKIEKFANENGITFEKALQVLRNIAEKEALAESVAFYNKSVSVRTISTGEGKLTTVYES